DPDAIVFGIGFTGVTLERIDAYLARGNLDYTDALDVHLYGSVISEEQCLDYLQSEMKRRGKIRPIWTTEMGSWHRDQDALCQEMVKKHVTAFACGVHRAEWHAFGTPEWNREASMWRYYWGFREPWLSSAFLAAEVQPRYFVPFEKVGTYYNLVRHLDYVEPRNRFTYGEDVRVYAFDRDGERVYGVWQLPSATGTGRSLAINTTSSVTVIDAYGRQVELNPGRYGRVAFPVSLRPRLVSVQGSPGQPCGDAFDPVHFGKNRDDLVFRPGPFQVEYTTPSGDQPVTLTVQVTNTFAQAFRGRLQVELDDTWRLEPAQTRVDLPPGKSLTTRFTLRPETEKAPGTYAVKLLLRDDEGILPAFSEVHFTLGQ
ncbi:MAG: hypothetical protein GX100_07785, partial [candidate division WS1 bacterium]|nr:hypothetical protein [candidate division WS1 bacterium]